MKSRAKYNRERRKNKKTFSVLLPKEIAFAIESKLSEKQITKTDWILEMINNYLKEDNNEKNN